MARRFIQGLVFAILSTGLSGCVSPVGGTLVGSDGQSLLNENAKDYWSFAGVVDGFGPTGDLPTDGTATYTGGAYVDMTQPGQDGNILFNRLTLNAAFRAGGGVISGALDNGVNLVVDRTVFDDFADALSDRGLSEADFDAALENVMKQAILTSLSGSAAISEADFTTSEINSDVTGTFSAQDIEIKLNAPVYGFFAGDGANTVRVTGTNVGMMDLELNGNPIQGYFDGYAQKD